MLRRPIKTEAGLALRKAVMPLRRGSRPALSSTQESPPAALFREFQPRLGLAAR